jgi:cell division protein FtsN
VAGKRKRRSRASKKKADEQTPGWAWGLFGLAVGLSVAAAVWVSDRSGPVAVVDDDASRAEVAAPEPSAYDDNGERDAAPADEKVSRFDFYTMLPNAEVVVSDIEPDIARDTEPAAIVEPGRYVLQAGSFSTYEDADRRRAELALHGIESRIQRVTIDGVTYHRVRIGPTSNLDELNMLRSRLRAANIDVMRIRFDD